MDSSIDSSQVRNVRFCGDCGQEQALGLRFCGGCGQQMGSPVQGDTANATIEEEVSRPTLGLLQAWGCFFGSVITLNISFVINITLGCIAYLVIGVFMSRFVMARLVEWHPNYNTLYNVVSVKVWMVILWPARMLMLLLQLTANKIF